MFRKREIAKTIELNFIIVIRVIVLPKKSYSPFISYDYYSIKKLNMDISKYFQKWFF